MTLGALGYMGSADSQEVLGPVPRKRFRACTARPPFPPLLASPGAQRAGSFAGGLFLPVCAFHYHSPGSLCTLCTGPSLYLPLLPALVSVPCLHPAAAGPHCLFLSFHCCWDSCSHSQSALQLGAAGLESEPLASTAPAALAVPPYLPAATPCTSPDTHLGPETLLIPLGLSKCV